MHIKEMVLVLIFTIIFINIASFVHSAYTLILFIACKVSKKIANCVVYFEQNVVCFEQNDFFQRK